MSLSSIENLKTLMELLPQSIAVDRCVLVISECNGTLTLACPETGFGAEDRRMVEFLLSCELEWQTCPRLEIQQAIQFAYGTISSVENCRWKFANQCPEKWESFDRTGEDSVRHCRTCAKSVHLCFDENEVAKHASFGHCVCFVSYHSGESIGDVELLEDCENEESGRLHD